MRAPSSWRWGVLVLPALLPGAGGSLDAAEDLFTPMQVERFTPPREDHDFALETPGGKTIRLSAFQGLVVFLNFWASWCPACREEMPSMEELHQEFKDHGLVVLAVSLRETPETVAAFMKEFDLTFPALLDQDGAVSDRHRVAFIPTTHLVARDGTLLGRVVGPKDWSALPARRLIASLLDPALAEMLARAETPTTPAEPDAPVRAFLERHWQSPIPPQGEAPAGFTPLEASLGPQSCGTCHPVQHADWQTSFHAKAMGPGVMGQLVDMIRSDPDSALDCQRCHSPLAEQRPLVRRPDEQGRSVLLANPVFDQSLQEQGLVCAACHVREWERFGPPTRNGRLESSTPRDELPHNGVTRTPAFVRSEFCKGCHQFPAGGFALNGKLLENTYEEWKASAYARRGVQCQDCHMPDRRHLWRGIHDPEMVKQGVTIDLETTRAGSEVSATLTITNSGVGHYFPTYLTPKVFARMDLVDAQGQPLEGSLREAVLGREVPLDLSRELYDTRLAPKASFAMKQAWTVDRAGLRLRARVVVEPDHFYTRFFQATIPQAAQGQRQLEEALGRTRQSSFTIFSREVLL